MNIFIYRILAILCRVYFFLSPFSKKAIELFTFDIMPYSFKNVKESSLISKMGMSNSEGYFTVNFYLFYYSRQ